MSDGLKAMRDAAPLMPLSARPPRERPNRDIIAFAAARRTSASSASGGFDTRLSRHEGHCLDSRSCSDLASGGDLSKGHPNYQTSTRGQTMQQVVTRGRGGNGGARCCGPRFAWAKAPMRLARTPGHASRKALTRRFPLACHGDRRHRFPQDLGTSGAGGVRAVRASAWARPSVQQRASCTTIPERASGMTYPLSAGAVGHMTSAWHRNIRWQAGRSWGRVAPDPRELSLEVRDERDRP